MSSNRMIASGLEGRYAVAIFALALEEKALDSVAKDLEGLKTLAAQNADFSNLLLNPSLDKDTQHNAISAIAKKAKLSPLTAKFLGVLVANRRLANLEKIATTFGKLLSEYRGEIEAQVISAEKMTKAQEEALKQQLKKNLGQDISFEVEVDPELLGGLKVKVGSKVIDSSIKTKLENLTLAMKGV